MTTRLVFAHKGVEFDRVDLVAGVHKSGLRLRMLPLEWLRWTTT